ncbi:hypothetical protein WJ0W_002191 [Paenibacillus melissococcoides]|uniref:DUF2185 domain-containing protein n=1 Tax=Paenibacillus melissococcoides TaxID=2912268 RepID=A0ABN8U1X6_9BACL|nr:MULTISPECIES: hypothetical protein [Paenibacillus]MEB9894036.1 hypothetical protein [Bacillus cereus]CAH8244961.1 hypothetical protein WJ0W_002191 [Paenibacillus melissococcoides]CAH8709492.1 hypothetical protein WDD9_002273 [Paenibacillus melissococcoides]CAH8710219.1 hypothetical protein HTL2_002560 [Paenibacillus melissococcoides]GIO82190.1 hypothetical protein J6TS7_58000 [Paenibacillus dendritiformis]
MVSKKNGFVDLPNTMVLTTRDVIEKKKEILFVSHDADDGMWQFHSGNDVDMDSAMLVALEEIVEFHPSITEISDLPVGWIAWREDETKPWHKERAI